MRITYIIGLPGSGKTFLANELNRTENNYIIDDPKSFTKDILPYLDGRDLIITDPILCIPKIRKKSWIVITQGLFENNIDQKNITAQYIYFENDIDKCKKNVKRRKKEGDNRDVEISIELLSELYEIPYGINSMDIWNGEK